MLIMANYLAGGWLCILIIINLSELIEILEIACNIKLVLLMSKYIITFLHNIYLNRNFIS